MHRPNGCEIGFYIFVAAFSFGFDFFVVQLLELIGWHVQIVVPIESHQPLLVALVPDEKFGIS